MQDNSLGGTNLDKSKTYELLEELELKSPVGVEDVRGIVTIAIDAAVEIRPADANRRHTALIHGSTRKLASKSLVTESEQPVEVGSVFHLSFDRGVVDLPPILAVCDSCAMLEPTTFEAHFQFTHPVDLPRGDAPFDGSV